MTTANQIGLGTDGSQPFGNPDGARANITEVERGFVDFNGHPAYGALATRAEDASARIIVGKLGAGKTVYLRRLQNFQSRQESVFADHLQSTPPSTEAVVKVGEWYDERDRTEKWTLMWDRAILRSVASYLLKGKDLSGYVSEETKRALSVTFKHLLGDPFSPRSVYDEVKEIIESHNSGHHLTKYLNNAHWTDVQNVIADALHTCPPVFFYLDAIDDQFHHAPYFWLSCQLGLFMQTMTLLRDTRLGGRLHVVICIRDVVISAVFNSEHASRYDGEPHIRLLDWTPETLDYLLASKVTALPDAYKMDPDTDLGYVTSWLGSPTIRNDKRETTEDLKDYLLRHTRLIPRDVVTMGNALCQEVLRHKAAGRNSVPPESVRKVVAKCAAKFGDAQLAVCANQMVAAMMPNKAATKGYATAYTQNTELNILIKDDLRSLLKAVGKDRFSAADLRTMEELAAAQLRVPVKLATILWQNGLLGYVARGEVHFYSLSSSDRFDLPRDEPEYVLHPCLIDAVPGIRPVGNEPVRPYPSDA